MAFGTIFLEKVSYLEFFLNPVPRESFSRKCTFSVKFRSLIKLWHRVDLEVNASAANDFRVRTKRGIQHYYKKQKKIRYLDVFNIINILILLSECWREIGYTSEGSVINQSWTKQFPLATFCQMVFCLINGQLVMFLRHVKRSVIYKFQGFCLFDIRQWSVLS